MTDIKAMAYMALKESLKHAFYIFYILYIHVFRFPLQSKLHSVSAYEPEARNGLCALFNVLVLQSIPFKMLLPYDTSREPRGISTPKVSNTPYILTAYDVTSQEIDTRLLLV